MKIKKRIIRTITYSSSGAPTDVLFKALDILPFNNLVLHRIGIFTHKIHLNKSPECISNMFTREKDIHNNNARLKLHLHIRKCNHEYVYRRFIYQGVYIWNIIIDHIEVRISVAKIKLILKKFIRHTNIPLRYTPQFT